MLILYSQLHVMLGLPKRLPPVDLLSALPGLRALNLAVGVVAALVIWYGPRITRKVPAPILGGVAGTALYYLLAGIGLEGHLGPVIGATPISLPDGSAFAGVVMLVTQPGFFALLPSLIAAALSVAIVASLDILICAKIVEGLSHQRASGNRELQRIGAANMVTSLLGGLAGAISIASSTANYKGGGRTGLAVLVHSVVILAAVVLLPPLFGRIPQVVIAAMLTVTALQLFDRWSLQLVGKILLDKAMQRRRVALDLVVIVLVTTMAILGDIVTAVLIGMGVAVVFFVLRMSRSVIRREYRGDVSHSRRTRFEDDMQVLAEHGGRIVVLELDGPLFFGSGELLAERMDVAMRSDTRYVILDFRRVNEVDSTGARLILQMSDRMWQAGRTLLLAGAEENVYAIGALRDAGVLTALTRERLFADVDHALEWAEDDLLANFAGEQHSGGEHPLGRMGLLRGCSPEEQKIFRQSLVRRLYARGEVLFREGDEGDELFILAKGSASVNLRIPGRARAERLVTFSPGTVFGELALLDHETRSASVEADEDLVCYVLSRERFDALVRDRHTVAVKLLANLGRELSLRLRRANQTLTQMGH